MMINVHTAITKKGNSTVVKHIAAVWGKKEGL